MNVSQLKITLIIAATCMVGLFSGCQQAPDAKLAAAQAALKAAKDAEADKYLTSNYENMVTALKTAEAEIATQKQGFILTRKYKRVTESLEKIAAYCNELKEKAPQNKAVISKGVQENLGLVDGLLEATAKDIKKASRRRRRKEKALFEELDGNLEKAKEFAAEAKTKFAAGDVLGARSSLDEVQGLMKKITDSLNPPKQS